MNHATVDELFPQFASRLIRNGATLGGNLGTASPIGDTPPALLASPTPATSKFGPYMATAAPLSSLASCASCIRRFCRELIAQVSTTCSQV